MAAKCLKLERPDFQCKDLYFANKANIYYKKLFMNKLAVVNIQMISLNLLGVEIYSFYYPG